MTDPRLPERRVIVVLPTRYGPAKVPSITVACERCEAPSWLSARARLELTDVIACVVCAMAVVKSGDLILAASWTLADMADLASRG